jgi:hypothetical protein
VVERRRKWELTVTVSAQAPTSDVEDEAASEEEGDDSDEQSGDESGPEFNTTPTKKRKASKITQRKKAIPSTPTRRVVPKLTRVAKARADTRAKKRTKFSKKQHVIK